MFSAGANARQLRRACEAMRRDSRPFRLAVFSFSLSHTLAESESVTLPLVAVLFCSNYKTCNASSLALASRGDAVCTKQESRAERSAALKERSECEFIRVRSSKAVLKDAQSEG